MTMRSSIHRIVGIGFVVLASSLSSHGQEVSSAQAKRDATVVETLIRLKRFDVQSKPKLKAAVLRHLETQKGTPKYLELIERFNILFKELQLIQILISQLYYVYRVAPALLEKTYLKKISLFQFKMQ